MKEISGNIFKLMETGQFDGFCVTTNGQIKKDGKAVMGAGIALECKKRFNGIDECLAYLLKNYGNKVSHLGSYEYGKILSFPTKNHWRDNSDIELIKESCRQLEAIIDKHDYKKILIPRPGCSNGRLKWEFVKSQIEEILSDRVYVASE